MQTIHQINEKLDGLLEQMGWMIRAEQRFTGGQRVEWSTQARKQGFPTRKRAKRGTVKSVNGFTVVVKLDSLKTQTRYPHMFFNPVNGPKLF